ALSRRVGHPLRFFSPGAVESRRFGRNGLALTGLGGGRLLSYTLVQRLPSHPSLRIRDRASKVPGLLRGARRAAHGEARGDQARLSEACAEAPSRPSASGSARQGLGTLQGDQRGLRGTERSGEARQI